MQVASGEDPVEEALEACLRRASGERGGQR
jgi:hypothetical protein